MARVVIGSLLYTHDTIVKASLDSQSGIVPANNGVHERHLGLYTAVRFTHEDKRRKAGSDVGSP